MFAQKVAKPRFIPRWRKMTWALVIFTLVMAVSAIAAGVAVNATETPSVADIRGCIVGGDEFSTDAPENPSFDEECIEGSGSADDVVGLILFLWLIGFGVLSLIWVQEAAAFTIATSPFGLAQA